MCAVTSPGRRRGAFTLIEMLVVMGIILILATLGVEHQELRRSKNTRKSMTAEYV